MSLSLAEQRPSGLTHLVPRVLAGTHLAACFAEGQTDIRSHLRASIQAGFQPRPLGGWGQLTGHTAHAQGMGQAGWTGLPRDADTRDAAREKAMPSGLVAPVQEGTVRFSVLRP